MSQSLQPNDAALVLSDGEELERLREAATREAASLPQTDSVLLKLCGKVLHVVCNVFAYHK